MYYSDRVIAFDFGTRFIGIAVGQSLTRTAQSLTTLKIYNSKPEWYKIKKLFKEWQPNKVVVGLPLNMDGSDQPLTFMTRKFANQLHNRFGIQAVLHDERLSTVEARSELFARSGYRALKINNINARSAVIILESWFNYSFSK